MSRPHRPHVIAAGASLALTGRAASHFGHFATICINRRRYHTDMAWTLWGTGGPASRPGPYGRLLLAQRLRRFETRRTQRRQVARQHRDGAEAHRSHGQRRRVAWLEA